VTQADLEAERSLIDALQQHWPDEPIFSEERGKIGNFTNDVARWVVDPIDGTSAFSEGLSHWGPTVARLAPGGQVMLGAIYLPRLQEFYFVEGGKAWLNDSQLPPLEHVRSARVAYLPSRFHRYGSLDYPGKGRCLGGTAAHLAGVARGGAEVAIVAPGWALWDTAAGIALIEAVGGLVARYDGAPLDLVRDEGVAFIAGIPRVIADFLKNHRVALLGASNAG
jgi:myo-inositol-1(or 4)-monophosphatase